MLHLSVACLQWLGLYVISYALSKALLVLDPPCWAVPRLPVVQQSDQQEWRAAPSTSEWTLAWQLQLQHPEELRGCSLFKKPGNQTR